MNSFDFSLENYLKNCLENDFDFKISNNVVEIMKKMISRQFDNPINRWYYIKEIRKILINDKNVNEFSLHLENSLAAKAYMKDSGELYISLGSILFKSSRVNLKVFCHELAHIWLSQQPFYSELKELNKEFKQKYSHLKECYLASPIELYAMVISYELMNSVLNSLTKERTVKKWSRIVNDEAKKILEIKNLLLTL